MIEIDVFASDVFPTRVGVNRDDVGGWGHIAVFPTRVGVNRRGEISTHASYVFPTRVGVNRHVQIQARCQIRFPHPRGGEPKVVAEVVEVEEFSPPAWG